MCDLVVVPFCECLCLILVRRSEERQAVEGRWWVSSGTVMGSGPDRMSV